LINGVIHYHHGQWTSEHQEASSNYCEFKYLILGIKEAIQVGLFMDCEVFIFTDNTTAEAAFHKGTSSSKTLFQLIRQLCCLQMHQGLFIHVIHVAGTWMQHQGTDDLSRGQLSTGVLGGGNMLAYIPLHLSATQRSPALQAWVTSCVPGLDTVCWLTPYQWYAGGSASSCQIWCPPTSAADTALEQLSSAIHKRPYSTHIVLIPRLLTSLWRRLLGKICDRVFTVLLGPAFWPLSHFEPLIAGFYLQGEPLENLASDVHMLKCIWRVNLDAFWYREPGTVNGVSTEALQGLKIALQLGFAHGLIQPRGPFAVEDSMGMAAAIVIVQRSLAKGCYSINVQYETSSV
jgi:hypothetical protein